MISRKLKDYRFFLYTAVLCCICVSGCSVVRERSPFFSVPREQVIELSTQKVEWLRDLPRPHKEDKKIPLHLQNAVSERLERFGVHTHPGSDYRCVSNFLTMSDAQIRDENVYAQGKSNYIDQLIYFDRFYGVTIRRTFVEKFDSLTFASFLTAYRKEVEAEKTERDKTGTPDPFIIHTGDLTDISTTTELLTALSTVHACLSDNAPPVFFSMGGNHDGLIFGNIPNHWVDMRSLGVNLSEFVLAHLLIDSESSSPNKITGYGFGENELIRRFHKNSYGLDHPRTDQILESRRIAIEAVSTDLGPEFVPVSWTDHFNHGIRGMTSFKDEVVLILGPVTLERKTVYPRGWQGKAARQANQIITAAKSRSFKPVKNAAVVADSASYHEKTENLYVPMIFSDRIEVPDRFDGGELQLAYYHWDQEISPQISSLKGIRYVVLDTRNKDYSANGQIGLIQLGWLYNRLAEAFKNKYAVVIFGHHSPEMMDNSLWTANILEKATTNIFCRMLKRFPNIIAYFHGHDHWNKDSKWPDENGRIHLIQTGSLSDFPQVGRKIWIYVKNIDDGDYEAVVSWEFVRPRGNGSQQGEILDSLLSTSQKESLKEFNNSQNTFEARFHRMQTGWGLWNDIPGLWQEVATDLEDWRNKALDYGEAVVSFSLKKPMPPSRDSFWDSLSSQENHLLDAENIFKTKRRLRWTNAMRKHLGCEQVFNSPEDINPPVRPPFLSPSGVAVLTTANGERVAVVANEENSNLFYRTLLAPSFLETTPLRVNWNSIALPTDMLEDVEALARWNDRQLFAICSQSRREQKGLIAAKRDRLALISFNKDITAVSGVPFTREIRPDLIRYLEKKMGRYLEDVDALLKKRPNDGGINVEGMVHSNGMLLIGLRDPITINGYQIIIPLMNPTDYVQGEADPDFGIPLLLNTGKSDIIHRLVRWQPPARHDLIATGKNSDKPIVIDLNEQTLAFPALKQKGIQGDSVPEGICTTADDTGFIIVRDPETFDLEDELVVYVSYEDIFPN